MKETNKSSGYTSLLALQQRLYEFWQNVAIEEELDQSSPGHPLWLSGFNTLSLAPMWNGVQVNYFGSLWEDPWLWVKETLAAPEVSSIITSLNFSGPDEGSNGSREWEFTEILNSDAQFPLLRSLFIKPTAPEDHNISLIQRAGTIMEEGGDIARLVAKARYLSELTVPNAPDENFFNVPLLHLNYCRIGGGYDTQQFIRHLAQADNLPSLTHLDFSECTELRSTWQSERQAHSVTSFEEYKALITSPVGQRLKVLCLRNTGLSLAEMEALQALQPQLQFMVIQDSTGGYVSHFNKNVFPFRHLIQPDSGTTEMRY